MRAILDDVEKRPYQIDLALQSSMHGRESRDCGGIPGIELRPSVTARSVLWKFRYERSSI